MALKSLWVHLMDRYLSVQKKKLSRFSLKEKRLIAVYAEDQARIVARRKQFKDRSDPID